MSVLDINVLKQMLNIDLDDTSKDSYLDFILSTSEKIVENYTECKLTPININNEIYLGNNSRFLWLKSIPVNSIIKVEISPFGNGLYVNDISSYIEILNSQTGKIFNSYSLFNAGTKYIISYNAGFNEIPDDLKFAIYQIAVRLDSLTEESKVGASKITTPDGTVVYEKTLLSPEIKEILDRYSRKL